MKTSTNRQSAKIYQFPAGGRAGLNRRGESQPVTALPSPRAVRIAAGDAWYHDSAIQEAEQVRRH